MSLVRNCVILVNTAEPSEFGRSYHFSESLNGAIYSIIAEDFKIFSPRPHDGG